MICGAVPGPQHSLRRVVSHHARLITDAASLLVAWQALPSASMLHASDNFISPTQPSKSSAPICLEQEASDGAGTGAAQERFFGHVSSSMLRTETTQRQRHSAEWNG